MNVIYSLARGRKTQFQGEQGEQDPKTRIKPKQNAFPYTGEQSGNAWEQGGKHGTNKVYRPRTASRGKDRSVQLQMARHQVGAVRACQL